jgi:Family of unknown function (DUF6325)
MTQDEALGPVGFLVVEFPGNKMTGDGLLALVDLVDLGLIRVLDLEFVMRDDDGTIHMIELADIDGDGELDLSVFEGSFSGLLDETDHAEAGSALEPGSSAAVLIYENRWATQLVQGLRNSGGEVVAAGFIPHDDLVASLDAAGL